MIHTARLFSKQGQNKDMFRHAKQRQFTNIRRCSEELLQNIIEKEDFHKEDKTCKMENPKTLANHIKPNNY